MELLKMTQKRGEMGHKKESVKWRPRHNGRGDNVIASVYAGPGTMAWVTM